MSVHLSEEEQLEVLKRWWKEYGKTVVVAVVIAIAGYFAYTAWQDQQRSQREAASDLYEDLLQIVTAEQSADTDNTTAVHLANQLKEADSTSLYAHNAAFILARLAVVEGDLDEAASQLNWVLANKPALATEQLARLRLARVLISQQAYDEAEKLLTTSAEGFKSEYAEARADIHKARGNFDAARAAYEEALADVDPQQQERVMLLQLKRDDLKSPSVSAVTQPTPAETAQ